jgi:hypothetical protein
MNRRRGAVAAVVAVLLGMTALAAYWYWSPLLTMRTMRAAAEEKDADRFNQYVDYARLRESLKVVDAVPEARLGDPS